MKKKYSILFFIIFQISYLISGEINFSHIPIQESGRIKPLDTYARNHLLLFYGKEYLKEEDADNKKIDAITWLEKLLSDPTNELHQRIFYISSWSNSPEVEISLGLDGRSSHKYSFYEIIDGFKNNQELLDNLKLKSSENYTYVEQQIVDIYSKVVLLDEIAHSFTCLLPKINIVNQEIRDALKLKSDVLLSYSFFVNNIFLFSPLMEELLKIDPTLWTEKHRELNDIAIELHQIGQYQYAKALKVIPPNINDADKEWLSPLLWL